MAQDRYKYFRIEAGEIVDQLGRGALALERDAPADAVLDLLRLAHTLKGAARVVRLREIADDAHALEDALDPFRDGGAVPRDRVNRVLALIDGIARRVARLGADPDAGAATPALAPEPAAVPAATGPASRSASAEPAAAGSAGATAEEGAARPAADAEPVAIAFRPATDDLDALLGHVFEAQVQLGGLRPALARLADARHTAAAGGQARRVGAGATPGPAVVVGGDAAGALSDLVAGAERQLSSGLELIDRELRQVREAAERLRLAPVSGLFTFLARAVRDAAHALDKAIVLETSGGDVRVDAAVLTTVQGALLHLVRNAATHGIEDAGARLAAGKPAEGRIRIAVEQRGRHATFSCSDDGRGLDLAAIRAAVERRAGPDAVADLDAAALLRALLRGGISTSGAVTDLSGRGIGLDAVRAAAARLGGELAVRTDAGAGTTFTLTVPVSIASIPALVVDAGGTTVAVPLDAVRRAVRLDRGDVVRSEQHDTVLIDGEAVPLAPLARLIAPDRGTAALPARASVVVVRGRTASAAFVVDRVIGSEPVIQTPLPVLAPASPVIAGAALDAVGDPLLIVAPDELVAAAGRASFPAAEAAPVRPPVLVIDDSLTTRMLEQSILEAAGYAVDLATSGEEGLDKARRGRYALFLVDVEMPGMDGFTFVERIRADPALAHVPAILVTSRSSPEDRQRGLAAGAQAYIVKGEFDQSALLDRLKVLIG